jgi:hypothetical protein
MSMMPNGSGCSAGTSMSILYIPRTMAKWVRENERSKGRVSQRTISLQRNFFNRGLIVVLIIDEAGRFPLPHNSAINCVFYVSLHWTGQIFANGGSSSKQQANAGFDSFHQREFNAVRNPFEWFINQYYVR